MKDTCLNPSDISAISFFSKRNCDILKGISILLMYFHHLFAFPDRVFYPYYVTPIINAYYLEFFFAEVSKICVPIFLFLSGVGFSFFDKKHIGYYLDKVIVFYMAYLIVFFIFIPTGFFLFGNVNELSFSINSFLSNLFMFSSSYNGEWWFASVYVLCVTLTPLLKKLGCNVSIFVSFVFLCAYFAFHFLSIKVDPIINNFLLWQVIFICGLFFFKILHRFDSYKFFLSLHNFLLLYLLFTLVALFLLFQYLKVYVLIMFTPFLCLLTCMIVNNVSNKLTLSLEWFGRRTLFMWLTHSFFCYYYFQEFVFYPKYSFLVFLNLIILTLPCCLVLEKIFNQVLKLKSDYLCPTTG